MENWLIRTELLLGKEKLEILKKAHILVVGLGGVGAYTAEQLCRAGIGKMTIVDGDVINSSNRNRQLAALSSLEGKHKAVIMANRLLDINPHLQLETITEYIKDERLTEIIYSHNFDYVVDAIDTLSPKIYLIYQTVNAGLKLVSSMGSGGKMDPSKIHVADISQTQFCPLALLLRKRLHRLGIYTGFKAVFSTELIPENAVILNENEPNKKSTVGTISYMPPIFGCIAASVVIRELLGETITSNLHIPHHVRKKAKETGKNS
jgi:tRNA A37 threonylcarbamoyladenosine dehydratase